MQTTRYLLSLSTVLLFTGTDLLAQKPGAQWAITQGITTTAVPSQRRENPGVASATHFYVFGGRTGNSGGTVLNELWSFDGKAWVLLTKNGAAGSPPARDAAGVCWDALNKKIIVFGGQGATQLLNDTWEYDPSTGKWKDITPGTPKISPPARRFHSIAFDPASKAIILFGGLSGTNYRSDTWMFLGGAWVKLNLTTKPTKRAFHHLVTRPDFGDILLVAGADNSLTKPNNWRTDVWRFAGLKWVQIPTTTKPAAVVGNRATYDEFRQRIVMPGGNGINGGSPTGEISEFDCISNEWVIRWGITNYDPVLGQVSRYFMAYVSSLKKTYKISGQKPHNGGQNWLVTLEYQSLTPPTSKDGSAGCMGSSGTPKLTNTPSWLGRTMTLEVENTPTGASTLIGIGFQPLNVPLSLLGIGSSSCLLTVNPLFVFGAAPNTSGNPELKIPLPSNPAHAGVGVMIQALVSTTATSLVSNRIDITAGAL